MKTTTLVVLATCALVLMSCALDLEVPHKEHLGDIVNSSTIVRAHLFHNPPYQILLGIPSDANNGASSSEFEGEMTVTEGTRIVASFAVSRSKSEPSNWLQSQGQLQALILTWNVSVQGEPFGRHLRRGSTYNIEVSFTKMPPEGSSLWLSSISKRSD